MMIMPEAARTRRHSNSISSTLALWIGKRKYHHWKAPHSMTSLRFGVESLMNLGECLPSHRIRYLRSVRSAGETSCYGSQDRPNDRHLKCMTGIFSRNQMPKIQLIFTAAIWKPNAYRSHASDKQLRDRQSSGHMEALIRHTILFPDKLIDQADKPV